MEGGKPDDANAPACFAGQLSAPDRPSSALIRRLFRAGFLRAGRSRLPGRRGLLACHQQDQGGEISVAVVFSGFSNRPGQLALIGVAYLVASIAIVILMIILMIIILGGLESLSELDLDDPELLLKHAINLLLVVLIGLSLYVPVAMALWFAPALVIFRQVTAFEAMQMSIKGCLLNVLPFLVYGVLAMILMIIASIPLLLGWLIMLPVLIASVYVSYKDIFAGNSNLLESTGSITP